MASLDVVDTTPPLLNINMVNVTKLTSLNFLTWSLQVHSLLDGHDLAAFAIWRRQDKLIYSGLLGTLSPSIQSIVSKTTTTAEMWKKLSATYANPSWGHIQQLLLQLKQYSKGTKLWMTICKVLLLVSTFDQFALLGKPLEHEEQLEFILTGLSEDYKSVIEQIEGRETPPSLSH
ncbi:PREDICTED: uncharacterized protein LOC104728459 [Camelina sativa]|uniref:Uncharacterized protein LOC104728459 n=1 Tax=Camelina sativa TaxID=90675 RepID=A0ABM0USU6_CAMSA|nr:PREDICTED: uncharacterized protein LOC104728459 [Camelina sativa]